MILKDKIIKTLFLGKKKGFLLFACLFCFLSNYTKIKAIIQNIAPKIGNTRLPVKIAIIKQMMSNILIINVRIVKNTFTTGISLANEQPTIKTRMENMFTNMIA